MPDVERGLTLKAKLDELNSERAIVKSQLDRERLTTITANLIETITSPKFIERMRQFRKNAGAGANFSDAADLMSLESLRAAGADVPDDFRLTSRIFEDSETGMKIEIKPPKSLPGLDSPLGWGACGGGGGLTVCGCAGGSTT